MRFTLAIVAILIPFVATGGLVPHATYREPDTCKHDIWKSCENVVIWPRNFVQPPLFDCDKVLVKQCYWVVPHYCVNEVVETRQLTRMIASIYALHFEPGINPGTGAEMWKMRNLTVTPIAQTNPGDWYPREGPYWMYNPDGIINYYDNVINGGDDFCGAYTYNWKGTKLTPTPPLDGPTFVVYQRIN